MTMKKTKQLIFGLSKRSGHGYLALIISLAIIAIIVGFIVTFCSKDKDTGLKDSHPIQEEQMVIPQDQLTEEFENNNEDKNKIMYSKEVSSIYWDFRTDLRTLMLERFNDLDAPAKKYFELTNSCIEKYTKKIKDLFPPKDWEDVHQNLLKYFSNFRLSGDVYNADKEKRTKYAEDAINSYNKAVEKMSNYLNQMEEYVSFPDFVVSNF